jgi:hypothetical protein
MKKKEEKKKLLRKKKKKKKCYEKKKILQCATVKNPRVLEFFNMNQPLRMLGIICQNSEVSKKLNFTN